MHQIAVFWSCTLVILEHGYKGKVSSTKSSTNEKSYKITKHQYHQFMLFLTEVKITKLITYRPKDPQKNFLYAIQMNSSFPILQQDILIKILLSMFISLQI